MNYFVFRITALYKYALCALNMCLMRNRIQIYSITSTRNKIYYECFSREFEVFFIFNISENDRTTPLASILLLTLSR